MKRYDAVNKCVYYGDEKRIWVDADNRVHKEDPKRLDEEWLEKIDIISEHFVPSALIEAHKGGYTMCYIDGHDLHGNLPFQMNGQNQSCCLKPHQKLWVPYLFTHMGRLGEKTGYTFGDITCGNILIDKYGLHLIDLDVIVEWPLTSDYIHIWNNTLRIVFGE